MSKTENFFFQNQLSLVVARTENVFDLYANIYTEREEAHGMPENA